MDVEYVMPLSTGDFIETSLDVGERNPEAYRVYTVYVGSEVITLVNRPENPVPQPI